MEGCTAGNWSCAKRFVYLSPQAWKIALEQRNSSIICTPSIHFGTTAVMWWVWVPASYIAYCTFSVFYCTVQHYIRLESEKLWLKSDAEKSLSASFRTEWAGRICLEIDLWLHALKHEDICSPGFYFSCLNVIHVASEKNTTSVRQIELSGVCSSYWTTTVFNPVC